MSKPDYAHTVLLPQTPFPMRANLPALEPRLLERWDEMRLSERRAALARERPVFTFHDGPPYANGPIHIGHVLNKSLKDMIHRTHWMMGLGSVFIPGWDCHGLPIEWRVEEVFRASGRDKASVPAAEFRQACRDYAAHWLSVQAGEFKRLGVDALWGERYATMDYASEARIIRELHRFAAAGAVYRTARPVMWSPVEQTALAEAEVEYEERTYLAVYVRFPVVSSPQPELECASLVIWTTAPWTLPGNRCNAFGPGLSYAVFEVEATTSESLARTGERLVLADTVVDNVMQVVGVARWRRLAGVSAEVLSATICAHPWQGLGYEHGDRLYPADFVTPDKGTGFVGIAPSCGLDDYRLGVLHGEPVPPLIDAAGYFLDSVPLFAGVYVFSADAPILAALKHAGMLIGSADHTQRYPHSWRSRAPLVFRTTPQWFISMSHNDLRGRALKAIDEDIVWVPPASQQRIRAMVEQRPDWLISRQRTWGVPLALFVDKSSGEILVDAEVNQRIAAAVEREGAQAWFDTPPDEFLGPGYDPVAFERIDDILDVWFDSGVSFALSSEARSDTVFPASVVAEGSDQHRGYFQSGLLWSCGARAQAPYEACLTHGFVMDGVGKKMSKSLGNVVAPQDVLDRFGADILRLWAVASDYSQDLRVSDAILERCAEVYRKLRNTLRFLLGNLDGFDASQAVDLSQMPRLERWILNRLAELDDQLRRDCRRLELHRAFVRLIDFCTNDLSSFYFDVRKDALYCEPRGSTLRRAALTTLESVFTRLSIWLAPFLPFTAEEAWLARFPGEETSVHLETFPETPASWRDGALARRFERVLATRSAVLGALEEARRDKRIGANLEASVDVVAGEDALGGLSNEEMAELCLVARFTLSPAAGGRSEAVHISRAAFPRCERCRRRSPDTGRILPGHPICQRCARVVEAAALNAD